MKATAETLENIKAFAGLSYEQRDRIARLVTMRQFAVNQILLNQDEDSNEVFFIVSGVVRANAFTSCGKEVNFQDLGPGDMFGELAAIDDEPRANHIMAVEDVTVVTMSSELFNRTLQEYPSVAHYTLLRLTGLVRMLRRRLEQINTMSVRSRIRNRLLELARDQDETSNTVKLDKAPTHQTLADYIGSDRVAVTKEISLLNSLGVTEWRRGNHTPVIKDIERLKRMIDEEP